MPQSRLTRLSGFPPLPRQLAARVPRPDGPLLQGGFESPIHDTRVAAVLGLALGVSFTVCFGTGLFSHFLQHPPPWWTPPSRPVGVYRLTQGVHVATGLASVPLLLAKLWTVWPRFVAYPPFKTVGHLVERISLLPLVGGSLFMLATGVTNIARWYWFKFFFTNAHYQVAWITMGALVVHVGAKISTTGDVVMRRGEYAPTASTFASASLPAAGSGPPDRALGGLSRRGFLGTVATASGVITVVTVGETVRPFRSVGLLAPRRPDVGPQGLPVNRSARSAGVLGAANPVASADYRLLVEGPGVARPLSLSLVDLRSMSQHEAVLPITCVEGWSANARWRGVAVRDLMVAAQARPGAEVRVESMEARGFYRASVLAHHQWADRQCLLALDVMGQPLHIDHGFPLRLIAPDRPGVLQTKWVAKLVVR